jgi:hypothetical protein
MFFYWLLFLIVMLVQLFPVKNQKQYAVRLFVSLLPLFLFGAFRVNFGLDYEAYETYFDGVKSYGTEFDDRMEIGYMYLNKILPTFRSLLIIQSALLSLTYYYLFKWYVPSRYSWLGFLLLFLNGPLTIFFMLSGIRNGIAISILILSTRFIHQRKIIPFTILICLAYFFHNSVVLIAPLAYFISNGNIITNKNFIVWLLVMFVIAITSSTVLLENAAIFIESNFDRYTTYIEIAKEQESGLGLLIAIFSIGVSILFLSILKDKQLTAKEMMLVKFTLLFFISFLLGSLNMRISQYFASFFVVGSLFIINKEAHNTLKQAYFILIFAYSIYAFILWLDNPLFSYDTYESVLF